MSHQHTVFSQLLKLLPRHEFESLAKQHHSRRSFRTATRWSQFVTMAMGQLSGRNSLRDIVENLSAQAHRLYHLGSAKMSRSSLAGINEDSLQYCTRHFSGSCYNVASRSRRVTISSLLIPCTHLMHRPLISACLRSMGRFPHNQRCCEVTCSLESSWLSTRVCHHY